jgi:predicted methyltransferase
MLLGCGGAPRVSRSPSAPPSPEQHDAGEPDRAQAHGSIADGTAAIAATMRGSHRSRGAADRDQYRHPVETLAFLGFTPTMTVLDVGPGGRGLGLGYYTELLAPVLAKDGLYLATNREPPSTAPAPNTHHWTDYEGVRFDDLLRAAPDLYGKVEVVRVDNSAPKLNLDGKVDMVLLMREVHMMKNWGTLDTWLHEIHRALKPNGILGIEDHRAAPGTDPDKCAAMAYLPEAWVIAQVEAAGFTLVARSEINANPRDTRDHPKGAWTLPPELALGDVDRDKYLAIGESDRMTLKFVRATYAAAAVGWDLRDGVPRFGVEALAREVGRGSSTPRASAGTRGSQARRAAAGTRRCAAPVAGSPSPYGECAIG